MSKLPKAPLVEAIFNLKWDMFDEKDGKKEISSSKHENYLYTYADFYSKIKDEYQHKELVNSPELPIELLIYRPQFRFRKEKNSYPLIQIGPGILSINTVDKDYYWEEDFKNRILKVVKLLYDCKDVKQYLDANINFSLRYIDAFDFDITTQDILNYVSENLHLNIEQKFYNTQNSPKKLTLELAYFDEILKSDVVFKLDSGKYKNKPVILSQTKVVSEKSGISEFESWLDASHKFTSETFKKMTDGSLYKLFSKS